MSERLTAEELGILPLELEALLWVRDALDPTIPDHNLPAWIRFDMDEWLDVTLEEPLAKCETICCIGGSMELYLSGLTSRAVGEVLTSTEYHDALRILPKRAGSTLHTFSIALDQLFYSYKSSRNTRKGAVAAIDRFLSGNTSNPWMLDL